MSPTDPAPQASASPSRRTFLQTSTAAVVGTSLVGLTVPAVHAAGGEQVKVGLIGAGGRGSQAAINAMRADSQNRLTAICEIFPDRLEGAKQGLRTALGEQFQVTEENSFHGFDGYKRVMESDVDVVLLCTPPHFRPAHLKAAIDAGKHVFCEKPVAVDAPGVRSVLKTCEEAKAKNLAVVSGLCWRYDLGVRETIKRIQEGAIGDIIAMQENYLTGTLWHRGRQPEWSEMEYQLRNWLYFTASAWGAARFGPARNGAIFTTTTPSPTNGPTACGCSRSPGRWRVRTCTTKPRTSSWGRRGRRK
ncbi:MAG: Gfo/Idh/MocA family oxidoreductase [Pirellulaceae bacterium]|nr:Gfo/Idh/MocA family oxidoreductase [Pirellulaceae bacterium]